MSRHALVSFTAQCSVSLLSFLVSTPKHSTLSRLAHIFTHAKVQTDTPKRNDVSIAKARCLDTTNVGLCANEVARQIKVS